MWRLFSSVWQGQPSKLIGDEHTPTTPHTHHPLLNACAPQLPTDVGTASLTECHESNVKTVREERYLIIDEASGKASVSLRREETVSRSLRTTGGSTFQWRKATPDQAAAAVHAQQHLSDTPMPYRNFQGNILAEQTIAPGALPQLQKCLDNQCPEPPQTQQPPPPLQQPQQQPHPQPQLCDDAEMDLELSALAEDERVRSSVLYDAEDTNIDEAEMMELDDPEPARSICSDPAVVRSKARQAAARYYRALALKSRHPYAIEPPRSRAACTQRAHHLLAVFFCCCF